MGNEIQLAINQIFPRWKSTEKKGHKENNKRYLNCQTPKKGHLDTGDRPLGSDLKLVRASWLEAQWVETRCVLNHRPEMSYLPLGKAEGRDPTEMATF